jgi:hypothetical protein
MRAQWDGCETGLASTTRYLRLVRRLLACAHRVGEPRYLVVYRVAPDGITDIPSLVHDRVLLPGAARRARSEADC